MKNVNQHLILYEEFSTYIKHFKVSSSSSFHDYAVIQRKASTIWAVLILNKLLYLKSDGVSSYCHHIISFLTPCWRDRHTSIAILTKPIERSQYTFYVVLSGEF